MIKAVNFQDSRGIRKKRIWGKPQATLFVLACLGFLWFAFAGNLLHFSSSY